MQLETPSALSSLNKIKKPDLEHPLAIKIRKQITEAIAKFNLLQDGDKVMICVSGGKDSSVLLSLLNDIKRRAPYKYELEAVMLDQKQPGFDASAFTKWVENQDIKFTLLERDTYSIVTDKIKDGTYCSLCSRLRRGILYDHAFENKFTKMALGHHRDDMNHTLLMNIFYTGKLASMPPKLKSDDGRNILIRPLAFAAEKDIRELSQVWEIPIIPCNLCGSQTGMKRQMIKKLVAELEEKIPDIQNSMIGSQSNVHISHLMDQELWDFDGLERK
jgi:tRNA 2-thiocytidine biosynthesis protein TtcA